MDQLLQQFLYDPNSKLLFTSGLFVFLFLGFMAVYSWLEKRTSARLWWVTLFSLYFYYKCAGIFWILHVVIVIVDYHLALWIEEAETKRTKRWLLFLSLVLNLGILVYFKYTNYIVGTWFQINGWAFQPWDILLPVGVSFFTFQSLSYTIDVYKGELKALRNILDYAFFVTFFPQMVAGPIVRAADFLHQIRTPLVVTREQLGRAVYLICIGLFKKSVIANYISVNFVDRVFEDPAKYTGLENLTAVYGYALQIYCDFSAYSDMAIGIALLMGFTFPINFNAPYQSLSVTEFWRRWHISLSTWLRDYLYIPLGGSRASSIGTYLIPLFFLGISGSIGLYRGIYSQDWWLFGGLMSVVIVFALPALLKRDLQSLATSCNLLSTMLLGGLWHGAGNQFLVWGLLHGLALAAERWWKEIFPTERPGLFRQILGWVYTFHFVCFCWVFFRALDMNQAWAVISQIGFSFQGQLLPKFIEGYRYVLGFMAFGYLMHFVPVKMEQPIIRWVTALPLLLKALLVCLFAILVMQVKSSDVQEFIYFDF